MQKLEIGFADVRVKLEYFNFSGSIKDRAALNIITRAIECGEVNPDTCVVESSSGNFAIALAFICKALHLKFVPVIDPNINADYEKCLRLLCHDVIKVTERDETGGFLLTRIKTVKRICQEQGNTYWPNQYENPNNYLGYYATLGREIAEQVPDLDYLFIAVSSGGTITGVSRRIREQLPKVKIIAVDVEGSVIFGGPPGKRSVSGIGASQVPPLLKHASIDHILMLNELEIISGCHALLAEQNIFGGVSSGASYAAIKRFFAAASLTDQKPKVAFFACDRGNAYIDTIFNQEWTEALRRQLLASLVG